MIIMSLSLSLVALPFSKLPVLVLIPIPILILLAGWHSSKLQTEEKKHTIKIEKRNESNPTL